MFRPYADFGWDVLEKVLRKPSSDGLRDEVRDHAVAMGELQILVDPGLRFRGQFRRKLAGGKHHLMIAIRQVVTVDANIIELIVEAYCLGLLIGLKQPLDRVHGVRCGLAPIRGASSSSRTRNTLPVARSLTRRTTERRRRWRAWHRRSRSKRRH